MTTGSDPRRALTLSPGESFGAYTILGTLGRGGMGEVYRARDSRLGREVALKVLPDDAAEDPERIRRFEQEARAASALNHPNIVVIYEPGQAVPAGRDRPVRFLAMELLDGEPLNALLMGGRLPIKRTLDYACQIADGLSRAHESGIVHRDLKPSNIVVTRDGHLKILDFGLAKLRPFSADDKTLEVTTDPTLTSPGTLLGTVGYMAPEQVRSETATPASDQFAFGCILFEMLTGQRPFQRASPAETLSAILRDEAPALEGLNPDVPAPLRWIVERCLSKSPRDRYASTRDMARDLQKLRESSTEVGLRSSVSVVLRNPRRRRAARKVGGALLLTALVAGASFLVFQRLRPATHPAFQRLTFRHGVVWRALFAPHTNSILFSAAWEGQPTRTYMTLPESAGLDRLLEAEPQFPLAYSPDGSEVLVLLGVFRPAGVISGTLARVPALGGKPRRILDGVGWADWAPSGLLAAVRDAGTERILELRSADGALRTVLYKTTGAITWVRFSPDQKQIAFLHQPDSQDLEAEVRIVNPDGSDSRALTPRLHECSGLDWNPVSGEIWFTGNHDDRNTLWALTTSGRLRVLAVFQEASVLQSIHGSGERCLLTTGSRGARLVVRQGGGPPRELSWLANPKVADLSPDGRLVVFFDTARTQKSAGAWMRPIEGGDAVRLTEWEPGQFSPDGHWIIGWTPSAQGINQLALFPLEAGTGRILSTPGLDASDPSFAGPDAILFVGIRPGERKVWKIQTDGTGLRAVGASDCELPMPSPAGDTFACEGEGGRTIFVYPMEGGSGRRLYTHAGGGRFWYVRWDRKGERLFAVTRDRDFLTLDAVTGKVLSQETLPLPAFDGFSDLITAAMTPDASTQAYTVNLYGSSLFQVSGLK